MPHEFDRRILVATMGLYPQILTETVFALAVRTTPPFIPTEIHILTTHTGKLAAVAALTGATDNPLLELAGHYALPGIHPIPEQNIHVIQSTDGKALDDIKSEADSTAAADQIAALLKTLTLDGTAALHVSIAGGRKTMGFLLGYSLSLFGRPQDTLSHILVDPSLESHPAFFYPKPDPEILKDRNGKPIVAGAHCVSLANIPIVRLREGLPADLLNGEVSYTEAVNAANERLRPPKLEIDLIRQNIICHGVEVSLAAAEFAFVALMAEARHTGLGEDGALRWDEVSVQSYLDIYRTAHRPSERTIETLMQNGIDEDWFSMRVSRARSAIKKALGLSATPYMLTSSGKRPFTRSGFTLPSHSISIRR